MNSTSEFLLSIKEYCKKYGNKYNILPSIIAMMALLNSDNGHSQYMFINNLFNLRLETGWDGPIYSLKTKKTYSSINIVGDNPDELGTVYLRIYDNYEKSIEDWCKYIANVRKNKLDYGPRKYQNILRCKDYSKVIDYLVYDGYLTDQIGLRYDDLNYICLMRDTIVTYNLLKLDP